MVPPPWVQSSVSHTHVHMQTHMHSIGRSSAEGPVVFSWGLPSAPTLAQVPQSRAAARGIKAEWCREPAGFWGPSSAFGVGSPASASRPGPPACVPSCPPPWPNPLLPCRLGLVTKLYILNPKAMSVIELYGILDPTTRDWTDGVLSNIFREINKPTDKKERK